MDYLTTCSQEKQYNQRELIIQPKHYFIYVYMHLLRDK